MKITPKEYWKSLCKDWKLNNESIIPYEIWYEMEGYEIFERTDDWDEKMRKAWGVKK